MKLFKRQEKEKSNIENDFLVYPDVPMYVKHIINIVGAFLVVVCLALVVDGLHTYYTQPQSSSIEYMVTGRLIGLVGVTYVLGFLVARGYYISRYNRQIKMIVRVSENEPKLSENTKERQTAGH